MSFFDNILHFGSWLKFEEAKILLANSSEHCMNRKESNLFQLSDAETVSPFDYECSMQALNNDKGHKKMKLHPDFYFIFVLDF